ncbi:basic proline-rich protein-like [Mustela lutreola]|uniref:basic proline-rich protein-like n=1 Tax=Mustela lutreola TaxID=9666 RepID=UPI0027976203|nr:basic proline-rich protein-like [Mustela lutreola]
MTRPASRGINFLDWVLLLISASLPGLRKSASTVRTVSMYVRRLTMRSQVLLSPHPTDEWRMAQGHPLAQACPVQMLRAVGGRGVGGLAPLDDCGQQHTWLIVKPEPLTGNHLLFAEAPWTHRRSPEVWLNPTTPNGGGGRAPRVRRRLRSAHSRCRGSSAEHTPSRAARGDDRRRPDPTRHGRPPARPRRPRPREATEGLPGPGGLRPGAPRPAAPQRPVGEAPRPQPAPRAARPDSRAGTKRPRTPPRPSPAKRADAPRPGPGTPFTPPPRPGTLGPGTLALTPTPRGRAPSGRAHSPSRPPPARPPRGLGPSRPAPRPVPPGTPTRPPQPPPRRPRPPPRAPRARIFARRGPGPPRGRAGAAEPASPPSSRPAPPTARALTGRLLGGRAATAAHVGPGAAPELSRLSRRRRRQRRRRSRSRSRSPLGPRPAPPPPPPPPPPPGQCAAAARPPVTSATPRLRPRPRASPLPPPGGAATNPVRVRRRAACREPESGRGRAGPAGRRECGPGGSAPQAGVASARPPRAPRAGSTGRGRRGGRGRASTPRGTLSHSLASLGPQPAGPSCPTARQGLLQPSGRAAAARTSQCGPGGAKPRNRRTPRGSGVPPRGLGVAASTGPRWRSLSPVRLAVGRPVLRPELPATARPPLSGSSSSRTRVRLEKARRTGAWKLRRPKRPAARGDRGAQCVAAPARSSPKPPGLEAPSRKRAAELLPCSSPLRPAGAPPAAQAHRSCPPSFCPRTPHPPTCMSRHAASLLDPVHSGHRRRPTPAEPSHAPS